MLEHMNGTYESLRKSVRPIDGKIYGVCEINYEEGKLPEYYKRHKPYSHSEILQVMNTKEWNLYGPMDELRKTYNWEYVTANFESHRYLEAFGHVYITVFSCLKFRFLIHSYDFLNDIEKWKIFKTNKFENANEVSMLQMCYFFDLISHSHYKSIDDFRVLRNSINHEFNTSVNHEVCGKALADMNEFIIWTFQTP